MGLKPRRPWLSLYRRHILPVFSAGPLRERFYREKPMCLPKEWEPHLVSVHSRSIVWRKATVALPPCFFCVDLLGIVHRHEVEQPRRNRSSYNAVRTAQQSVRNHRETFARTGIQRRGRCSRRKGKKKRQSGKRFASRSPPEKKSTSAKPKRKKKLQQL